MSKTESDLSQVMQDPASFRDPAGFVFHWNGRVLRVVQPKHSDVFMNVWNTGVPIELIANGKLVPTRLLSEAEINELPEGLVQPTAIVLEHASIVPFTYPYEWGFESLRATALAHLELHLELLKSNLTLSDASAYNMQIVGSNCLFIDVLSIIPYRDGELWAGYDQFLREFFNPLILEAATGFSASAHYRGSLIGLTTRDTARLLPFRWKLKLSIAVHVLLPARVEASREKSSVPKLEKATALKLPKNRFVAMLEQLQRIIRNLPTPPGRTAVWNTYEKVNSYANSSAIFKQEIVKNWTKMYRPNTLIDLGCNSGSMSKLALENGAGRVIALDSDRASIDLCWSIACSGNLNITPLQIDWANPSPFAGWQVCERKSIQSRLWPCDGLLALAVVHHLVIGRNLPLMSVLQSLVALAPRGLIEFVPKSDPMIEVMLQFRKDIFPDYTIEQFRDCLLSIARIENETQITGSNRVLFEYSNGTTE